MPFLLLPFTFLLLTSRQAPIIVRITEPSDDPTGIAHVITQALGITGALTLLAVIFGVVFAAVLFWFRSRSR